MAATTVEMLTCAVIPAFSRMKPQEGNQLACLYMLKISNGKKVIVHSNIRRSLQSRANDCSHL